MSRKILIVYYSYSGNTRKIAEMISQRTNGTVVEIKTKTNYPMDYSAMMEQVKREIDTNFLPCLQKYQVDCSAYDEVIVGTPNWYGTVAPPVMTFLKQQHFTGKRLAVFCTHGGGGQMNIERAIKGSCPYAKFLSTFSVYGNGGIQLDGDMNTWLEELR